MSRSRSHVKVKVTRQGQINVKVKSESRSNQSHFKGIMIHGWFLIVLHWLVFLKDIDSI